MSVGRLKHLSPKHSGFFHIQRSVHFRRKNEFSGSTFVGRVLYVSAAKLKSGASCHKFFWHVKVSYYIYRYYVYSQFIKLFIIIPFCHQDEEDCEDSRNGFDNNSSMDSPIKPAVSFNAFFI